MFYSFMSALSWKYITSFTTRVCYLYRLEQQPQIRVLHVYLGRESQPLSRLRCNGLYGNKGLYEDSGLYENIHTWLTSGLGGCILCQIVHTRTHMGACKYTGLMPSKEISQSTIQSKKSIASIQSEKTCARHQKTVPK
jgi:hypothetical protein